MKGRAWCTAHCAPSVALILACLATPASAQVRAYVANQENASVTILDPARGTVLKTIDFTQLGFSPNCKPHHVAVERDGSFWYVTLIGDGRILKFDRHDSLVGQARTEVPGMIALDPTSDLMIVGRSMSAVNPPARVALVHRATMQVEDELEVPFPRPHGVVIDPRGEYAYVASLAENRMAVIHLADQSTRVIEIPGPPHTIVQLAVSPDGRWLAGSGQASNTFLVWDRTDPAAPTLVKQLSVGASPWDPVFAPDGRSVWFANLDANTVTQVSTATWDTLAVIHDEHFAQPTGLAITPDGRLAVVANRNQRGPAHLHDATMDAGVGFAAIIDARRHRVLHVVTTGRYAAGVAAR